MYSEIEHLKTEINQRFYSNLDGYDREDDLRMTSISMILPMKKVKNMLSAINKIQKCYEEGGIFCDDDVPPCLVQIKKLELLKLSMTDEIEIDISINEKMKESIVINLAHQIA